MQNSSCLNAEFIVILRTGDQVDLLIMAGPKKSRHKPVQEPSEIRRENRRRPRLQVVRGGLPQRRVQREHGADHLADLKVVDSANNHHFECTTPRFSYKFLVFDYKSPHFYSHGELRLQRKRGTLFAVAEHLCVGERRHLRGGEDLRDDAAEREDVVRGRCEEKIMGEKVTK